MVRSLLRGLTNRDDIGTLYRRLSELPNELTQFFRSMFNAIEPVYKDRAARVLRMIVASDGILPVVVLWADEMGRSSFLKIEMSTLSTTALDVRERMVDRYRDLLHGVEMDVAPGMPSAWGVQIGFLHRTVADFLRTSEMASLLAPYAETTFDPAVSLLEAFSSCCLADPSSLKSSDLAQPNTGESLAGVCAAYTLRLAARIHSYCNISTAARVARVLSNIRDLNLVMVPPRYNLTLAFAHGRVENLLAQMGLVKHLLAKSFLDWCTEGFILSEDDRILEVLTSALRSFRRGKRFRRWIIRIRVLLNGKSHHAAIYTSSLCEHPRAIGWAGTDSESRVPAAPYQRVEQRSLLGFGRAAEGGGSDYPFDIPRR